MSTCNAHYMNAGKELTIWNVSTTGAAENDLNEKEAEFFCFHPKRCFARYPGVQGKPFQLARRSKLVFLFPHELI